MIETAHRTSTKQKTKKKRQYHLKTSETEEGEEKKETHNPPNPIQKTLFSFSKKESGIRVGPSERGKRRNPPRRVKKASPFVRMREGVGGHSLRAARRPPNSFII